MAVSIEEMRAGIVQHYVGRGWSEESIRADDLPPEEVIRIYECIQKDEEASKHYVRKKVGELGGLPVYQNLPIE